jgi:hypothetical protein
LSLIEYLARTYPGTPRNPKKDSKLIAEGTPGGINPERLVGECFPFRNQKRARKRYLEHVKQQYATWSTTQTTEPLKDVSFPVLCGAGGIGKTTFVRKCFDIELQDPSSETLQADGLKDLLESCCRKPSVGQLFFRISFSDEMLREEDYRAGKAEQSLALRLLHQFLEGAETRRSEFTEFVRKMDNRWISEITLREVIDVIRHYSGFSPTETCMVVLHLDETNALLDDLRKKSYLTDCLICLANITMALEYTFLLCPLTGR